MNVEMICKRTVTVSLACLLLFSASAVALGQNRATEQEVLRVLHAAKALVVERRAMTSSIEESAVINLSDLAGKLQFGSDPESPERWSSNEFIRVVFSDQFLMAYDAMYREPPVPGKVVPRISFPERLLDQVWWDGIMMLDPKERIVSVEAVALKAELSPFLVEAILHSKDFHQRKAWAREEGRVLPAIFPVTEEQLKSAVQEIASLAKISVEDVRALQNLDPVVEENLKGLLQGETLETNPERTKDLMKFHDFVTRLAESSSRRADALDRHFSGIEEAARAARGEGLVPQEQRSRVARRGVRTITDSIERITRRFRRGSR